MSAATERGAARIASVVARTPDAVRLARVASLAVRIEPHLLRRLRLKLLRDVDVGAEADLWFCPLVESRGVDAIVLDRDVVEILREEIESSLLDSVIAIVASAHEHEPATLRLEEKVNALAVTRKRAALDEIDRELRGAIVAMRESDARAREIARWFLRAAPRLHPVVQEAPNAVALLLSASMLLGRRSPGAVRESKLTLKDLGWVLTADVLSKRVDVGVERLPAAVRFVTAGAQGSGTISIPPTDPRLVEVGWSGDGTAERRVIEATPGSVVTVGTDATDVRVVTLAGDEYELVPVAGTESAPAASAVDLTPYQAIAAACVQAMMPTRPPMIATATRVHPRYLFTAREPFGREQQVTLLDNGTESQHGIVPMADYDDLVAVESASGGVGSVRLATAPFTARQVQADGPLERQSERAVVLGYDGDTLRGLEADAEIDDFTGKAFRVLVARPPDWIWGLAGGPVIIDGRVRGIVNAVHVPEKEDDPTILNVIGAERIQDLLRRVLDRERAQQEAAQSGEDPAQNAPVDDVGPEPPAWLHDVCVTIRTGGAEDPPTTGLVVSDRLVVSTAVELRDREDLTVSTAQGTFGGRVLDYGTDGPLVYIGLTGSERFGRSAPLIRQSRRVRSATDTPDPADAMIVVAHSGVQTLRVKDARASGVLHARDPEGYRFEIDIADPEFRIFNGVLVWGEDVAGLVLRQRLKPGSSDHAPRVGVEMLSVKAIRESVEGATKALEALTRPATLRAFVSSTLRDFAAQRQHVIERLTAHGIESFTAESMGAGRDFRATMRERIDRCDLLVLLVGDERGFVPEGEDKSVTQLEFERARERGVDVLVFLSRDESRIRDREHLAWRQELRATYTVQFFDESPESLRIDEAIVGWKETRRRTANVDAPPAAETPGAPSGYRFAKVVLCGPDATATTSLFQRLVSHDIRHGNRSFHRGVRWVTQPPSAPELHAGLFVCAAVADENWPLSLDLERAALAVVVVPFQSEAEPVIRSLRSQMQRVRAASATIPLLVVISHADANMGYQSFLRQQLSDVQDVFFVTTRNFEKLAGGDIGSLIEGIIKRIDWGHQQAVTETDFADAKVTDLETTNMLSNSVDSVDEWNSRPGWHRQFGQHLGERVLSGSRVVLGPMVFEDVVLLIVGRARQRSEGLPAARLRDVPIEGVRVFGMDERELVRDVARELEAKSVALVVGSGLQTVIVFPSLLETAAEVRVPSEAKAILRAEWTGKGRDSFAALLVHYVYELHATVEAGWQTALSSGSAKISGQPTLYLRIFEAGGVAQLMATAGDEFGSSTFGSSKMGSSKIGPSKIDVGTPGARLREVIELVLGRNAGLSVQVLPNRDYPPQ